MSLRKLLVALVVLLLVILACQRANAQYINVNASRRQCTPFGCTVQDCRGSGVYIGNDDAGRSIVLTAGHCMDSTAQWYHVGYKEWIAATGVGSSQPPVDIGILACQKPLGQCVPLAESAPQPGSTVTVHSYLGGLGKNFHVTTSTVIESDENRFTIEAVMQSGDSGGAVMQSGSLVGIVSETASDGIHRRSPSFITSAPAIAKFVRAKLGKLPNCGKPQNAPAPPPSAPAPPAAPGVEEPPKPVPDPISTPVKGDKGDKGDTGAQGPAGPPGKDADVSFLTIELNRLRAKVAELEARKLPDIPVEIYNADTGELIGRRVVPLGQPIKLSTKDRKVK